MVRLSHPELADVVVEYPEKPAVTLRLSGWVDAPAITNPQSKPTKKPTKKATKTTSEED